MLHQVEAVREECNKNITVMAEEIKALETVSSVPIATAPFHAVILYRNVPKRATCWRKLLEKRKLLRKN